MAREEATVCVMGGVTRLAVLVLLTGITADGLVGEQEVIQQLNTSALNTALAFEPYRDLAARTTGPGVQHQHNILFSPLGLASALALLCRVSGSESRSQALQALGVMPDATDQSVDATISAITHLQHSLSLQEGGGTQRVESGPGPEDEIGGADSGNRTDVDDGAAGRNGTEDGVHPGGRFKVWSSLHVAGKPSLDYDSFLSRPQHAGPSMFNLSFDTKDLEDSDKLELNNYVYFKGSLL